MRYGLWSKQRLVGHTDLDVHTVTPTMRQGFVEPAAGGAQVLADATGVWRALADVKRRRRLHGEADVGDDALVLEAVERRENLDLELRDDNGTSFDCEFIRIYDQFDINSGVVDEMSDTEEEQEAEFQIHLSTLAGEERDEALAHRAEQDAEIEAMVAELHEERDEATRFGAAWPLSPPEDPRWETMQYLIQVHLKGNAWEDADLG